MEIHTFINKRTGKKDVWGIGNSQEAFEHLKKAYKMTKKEEKILGLKSAKKMIKGKGKGIPNDKHKRVKR